MHSVPKDLLNFNNTEEANKKEDPMKRKSVHMDEEWPRSGFSLRGWNENLPRDFIIQSPFGFLGPGAVIDKHGDREDV